MSNAFKNLKFAVCDYSKYQLKKAEVKKIINAASTYEYPDSFQYICFYYTGHGGCCNGDPFISDKNNDRVFVMKEIVSPFYSESAQHLGQRIRLFFLDCCLSKPYALKKSRSEESPLLLSARGNSLIAFSTAMKSDSKLNCNGSYWTHFLSKNLTSDKPLSTILDVTHEETVSFCREKFKIQEDIQRPHYISCVGPVHLKSQEVSFKKKMKINESSGI